MRRWIMGIFLVTAAVSLAGSFGLPVERIALPADQPEAQYLVCIWDDSSGNWLREHQAYDNSGSYSFQVPQWDRWYWIGLWDTQAGKYVFGEWIGHFE